MNEHSTIENILKNFKTIAVVGLSSNQMRPSNGVARYMQKVGCKVIPVNPNETEIHGEKSYANLRDIPFPVELVDIFRRSEEAGHAVDEAIAIGAKAVWMQEGVVDEEAAKRAEAAGLLVVMDKCWLKKHAQMIKSAA